MSESIHYHELVRPLKEIGQTIGQFVLAKIIPPSAIAEAFNETESGVVEPELSELPERGDGE